VPLSHGRNCRGADCGGRWKGSWFSTVAEHRALRTPVLTGHLGPDREVCITRVFIDVTRDG
jgi:hypothetical protein